jgi:hypothetical protein
MMTEISDAMFDRLRDVEDESLSNTLKLAGHERECAIRYTHINVSIEGIRGDIRKAAFAGVGFMLAALAFLIKLVYFSA